MTTQVSSVPIWWTTLGPEAFETKGKAIAPPLAYLQNTCHKSQAWFAARKVLGGDPVRLVAVAGATFQHCVLCLDAGQEKEED